MPAVSLRPITQESIYCRPLRTTEENGKVASRMSIPEEVDMSVAFLPIFMSVSY